MVRRTHLLAAGILGALVELASAGVALRSPAAQITPPPVSPFDPRSDYYGRITPRQDKDKDKDKDQKPLTAAFDKSTCGFFSGDSAKPFTCGSGECWGFKSFWGCASKDTTNTMTDCVPKSNINKNSEDNGAWTCDDKSKTECFTWLLVTEKDTMTRYECATKSDADVLFLVATPKTTSASTTSKSSSSSSSSSSASSTSSQTSSTSTTATSTTSTATPSSTAAPASGGLSMGATAGIAVGSILGGLGIIFVLYHFISTKINGDDETDEMPLMENKNMQWQGPWQGRGAE